MSKQHVVDEEGRYDGLTLREALPFVVAEVAKACDPVEIIVFGSVARGDEGPDSDIDLLVVFEHVDRADRRTRMREVRGAIKTFVPVDVVVADRSDMARRDEIGSPMYWPVREGRSVYQRAGTRVA
jgi:uncharacterized protein